MRTRADGPQAAVGGAGTREDGPEAGEEHCEVLDTILALAGSLVPHATQTLALVPLAAWQPPTSQPLAHTLPAVWQQPARQPPALVLPAAW